MALSQGTVFAGTLPGMQLKAWALLTWNGSVLTLVKGFNVTSVNRIAQGVWNCNFTTNMGSTAYVADVLPESATWRGLVPWSYIRTVSQGGFQFDYQGSSQDPDRCYVAFYE